MAEHETTIVLVGHCQADSFAMRSALGRYAPGAEFVRVNGTEELGAHADAAAFLVNRVLEGKFETDDGVGLIGRMPEAQRQRAALVSNFAESQAKAAALGAAPGFGKSELYSDKARETIEGLVGAKTDG